ncbi:flavin reductase family protein [Streptococcus chenjunshii]|uniref:Flavin reductase family protein n=1 Tax=Streptococcus chenjunshii TaxID=2173853 RepID=A0A372KMG9_9STRE|nr:flavin reductase [Streptococcus chenjunshii]AXQ78164.1 flavin reductase family protein [Streptococcus chenjunshii]RFU50691.1 flavin reductase family protein [Streptococcus chenjunshii]RFU53463.1 flavin reductase family protein [Streptococcus chenjunshii]
MKQVLETEKFYYGFPIFIIGYKDERFGYNITTASSSYSLGDMVVVGLFKGNNAAHQIRKYRSFTVNIPEKEEASVMEQAGFMTTQDKLSLLSVKYSQAATIDAPLLAACRVNIECQVEDIQDWKHYVNFTARITKRWADESLLNEDAHFKSAGFHPMIYMGDGEKRIYRYLDEKC